MQRILICTHCCQWLSLQSLQESSSELLPVAFVEVERTRRVPDPQHGGPDIPGRAAHVSSASAEMPSACGSARSTWNKLQNGFSACSAHENRICLRTRAYQLQLAPQTGKLLAMLDKLALQLRYRVLESPLYRSYLLLHIKQLIRFRCELELDLHSAGGHPASCQLCQQVGWISVEQAEQAPAA